MFLGISMSPRAWAMTLTAVALAIYLPFLAADWLAAIAPSALRGTFRICASYLALPFLLCLLHDRHALGTGIGSIFFYLYKTIFLVVGIVVVVYWAVTSGDFAAGFPVFGGLMTVVGLMVSYVSWRSDKRHEQEVAQWEDRADAPLDDQTEAILAAAKARSAAPKPRPTSIPLVLGDSQ